LCGGLSFLTRDIFESGMPPLRGHDSSRIPIDLAKHLLDRQMQSFDGMIKRWFSATLQSDGRARRSRLLDETISACAGIMDDIDAGHLCPIGLVTERSWAPWRVFNNHVVLVWGYERGAELTLHTYDSNFPGRDDITIRLDLDGAKLIATNGTDGPILGHIRGLLRLPYRHVDPSPAYA
jgi:hypothetical protein